MASDGRQTHRSSLIPSFVNKIVGCLANPHHRCISAFLALSIQSK